MTAAEFKSIREKAGLSQVALAAMLHCSRMQVWKYEAGRTPVPFLVAEFMMRLSTGKGLMP